jgi:hypothetical protein
MIELSHRDEWKGTYRGVTFLISRHSILEKDCWCYYLLIPISAIPEDKKSLYDLPEVAGFHGRKDHDYTSSLWTELDWHCGITYYERLPEAIKVGCDYNHYWDEGHYYSENILADDATLCIDSLLAQLPLLWRSTWDGTYHETEEKMKEHTELKRNEYTKENS